MRKERKQDLDSAMEALDAMERRKAATDVGSRQATRVPVGVVEDFFKNISVAAIKLSDRLNVGDTVEIENGEYTLRQQISSMQIDRKDVGSAGAGDDVGVKVSVPVTKGSEVYRLAG